MKTTEKCEDCGTRLQAWLGSDKRFPMGIKSSTGAYVCGPCLGKREALAKKAEA